MSRIRLTKQTANPPAPATDSGIKTVEIFAAEVSSVIKPKAIDSDGNVTDFVGPQGPQGNIGPVGPQGPAGSVEKLSVASIGNPAAEFASKTGATGDIIVAYQDADPSLFTVYGFDSTVTAPNNSPYVVAGTGGKWIALAGRYNNQDVTTAGTINGRLVATDGAKLDTIASGAQVNAALASQAEAEAGSENTKTMTALRTAQAIAIQRTYASQAEAEAGVENTHVMTPLRTFQAIAAAPKVNLASILEMVDDFISSNESSQQIGSLGWKSSSSGAGNANSRINGEANHPGLYRVTAGTATTGRSTIYLGDVGLGHILVGGGEILVENLVRLTGLLNQHDRSMVGLASAITTFGEFTDGIYFQFMGTLSPLTNIQLVTANGGVRTSRDTGIPFVSGNWFKLAFLVNSAGTSIQAYVNGTAVGAPITTNIPTGVLSPAMKTDALASGGGVAIPFDLDYFYMKRSFSTPR